MYKLHLGDCLDYMKSMPDKSVDAVITDPPYGLHDIMQGGGWAKNMTYIRDGADWDNKPATKNQIEESIRVGKRTIIWGGNYFELPPSRGWLVWNKRGMGFSMAQAELAWTNIDMPMRVYDGRRSDPNRVHPTQKPLGLMKWCVENYTQPTDTIFDPFMGSGTTGVAAVQLGRNFIGCEIDPDYFKIAEKRIHEATLQPSLFQEAKPQEEQKELL